MTQARLAILAASSLLVLFVVYGAVTHGETQGHAPAIPETGSEQSRTSPASGEQLRWQVISSGGTDGASASYALMGTVGQVATDAGTSESYTLRHGFWQDFAGTPDYICGDADASGGVDIDDVVYLIAYIFSGGPEPIPYDSGDADCSDAVDIDDVVWLIGYIFSGGNAPCDTNGDGLPDC